MQPKPSVKPVICQVLHSMTVGGAEVLARQFALGAQEEFDSIFVCLDELGSLGEQVAAEGFSVQVLNRKSGLDFGVAKQLATICREHNVAVLHAHQYTPFFYSVISRWRAMRRTPAVLFTEHGRTFPDFRRPKRVFANRFLVGKKDRVVAVGQQVRQALVNNEGIKANRIEVIYNGINVQQFAGDSTARSEVRKALGISEDTIAVFCVARLNPLKDHETTIRTMARLAQSHSNIKLFLIGEGEERARIEGWIREHQVVDAVVMLGLRHDVHRLMNAADVFLLTSVSEGIPLTLIEAMATGVPCVATDVGGIGEVIQHEVTGLLAAAKDDGLLAAHLIRLAENHSQRKEMGDRSVCRAQDVFSDVTMHQKYRKIYRQLSSYRKPVLDAK